MSANQLTTNLTLQYCKDWSLWEATREIVSNSLDICGNVPTLNFNQHLTISDTGGGIELKELCLLGVSHKTTSDSIGKFGEGLKIALIIFARLGYITEIRSKNFVCTVKPIEYFGEKVLQFNWEFVQSLQVGTEIKILNISSEHVNEIEGFIKEKFVSSDTVKIFEFEGNSIMSGDSLFNKKVFVQKLDNSKFSYDLKSLRLERDRNTASNWDISYYMGNLISQITDKHLITEFFKIFKTDCLESQIKEFYPNSKWIETFKELFGNNATITNNQEIIAKARYKGIKAVFFSNTTICKGFVNQGIKETMSAILEKEISRKEKVITKLTKIEKSNLTECISVISSSTDLKIPNIKVFTSNDKTLLGYSKIKGTIAISRSMLKTYADCLTTLTEETIHDNLSYQDGTPEFQVCFISNITKTINFKIGQKFKFQFSAKLLKSKSQVSGVTYYQYSVKLPIKAITTPDANEIQIAIL